MEDAAQLLDQSGSGLEPGSARWFDGVGLQVLLACVLEHFAITCRSGAGRPVLGQSLLSPWVQLAPCPVAEIAFFEESLHFSIDVGGPWKAGRQFNSTEVVAGRLRCECNGLIGSI